MADPVRTNPDLYRVVLENQRVRVLDHLDQPGDCTLAHAHPDSVMVTLAGFTRRLQTEREEVQVELPAFHARWLDAQEHSGTNIGDTPTHCMFIELKEPHPGTGGAARLGPST
jgi:hypothetical protein